MTQLLELKQIWRNSKKLVVFNKENSQYKMLVWSKDTNVQYLAKHYDA